MIHQNFADICTDEPAEGAIINNEFEGFREDYLVLHCLIKKYGIKSFFEIGTNFGTGTKIIKNAVGDDGVVFSLDLPTELIHHTLQPSADKKTDKVGSNCNLPFVQLRGDSMTFDFSKYPCNGYFIDGEHDYEHVRKELTDILKLVPRIVIFHDLHVPEVERAITDVVNGWLGEFYDLYRVDGTRIAYVVCNL